MKYIAAATLIVASLAMAPSATGQQISNLAAGYAYAACEGSQWSQKGYTSLEDCFYVMIDDYYANGAGGSEVGGGGGGTYIPDIPGYGGGGAGCSGSRLACNNTGG
jgi:hypothetical protein